MTLLLCLYHGCQLAVDMEWVRGVEKISANKPQGTYFWKPENTALAIHLKNDLLLPVSSVQGIEEYSAPLIEPGPFLNAFWKKPVIKGFAIIRQGVYSILAGEFLVHKE